MKKIDFHLATYLYKASGQQEKGEEGHIELESGNVDSSPSSATISQRELW